MNRHQIEKIDIELIDILPGHRCPSADAVSRLVQSFEAIGMRTPITVRYIEDRPSSAGTVDSYVLVTGAHRLAAAAKLGWQKVECFVADVDETQARLWEISENLHRADLTTLERNEQLAEWVEITYSLASQAATPKVGRGGHQPGGVNAAARELGVSKDDAHRAVKIAALTADAKKAAREVGLDNNRSALLAASKAEPEKQADAIRNYKSGASTAEGPTADLMSAVARELASKYSMRDLTYLLGCLAVLAKGAA